MPRARSTGKRSGASASTKTTETKVVQISKGPPAPGEEGYDPDKDGMVVGFQLGSMAYYAHRFGTPVEEVTPYDFVTDSKTGMRPGETKEPFGSTSTKLATSQATLIDKYTTLPPLRIWRQGFWLTDKVFDPLFDYEELPYAIAKQIEEAIPSWPSKGIPASLHNYYVTTGEGTPGNYIWRVWELPSELCGSTDGPKHPLMWDEKKYKKGVWGGLGSGSAYGRTETKPAEPVKPLLPKPAKVSIPAGVRVRCGGCGHWWKIDDLAKHADVCAGAEKEAVTDWAMMCDQLCGCHSLDDVSKCKPGFPRVKEAIPLPAAAEPKADETVPLTVKT